MNPGKYIYDLKNKKSDYYFLISLIKNKYEWKGCHI